MVVMAPSDEAELVLVDHDLSPSQERNLEKLIGRRVLVPRLLFASGQDFEAAARRAGFEVWVTHMFVFAALLEGDARNPASGEGVVLTAAADGTPQVTARVGALAA